MGKCSGRPRLANSTRLSSWITTGSWPTRNLHPARPGSCKTRTYGWRAIVRDGGSPYLPSRAVSDACCKASLRASRQPLSRSKRPALSALDRSGRAHFGYYYLTTAGSGCLGLLSELSAWLRLWLGEATAREPRSGLPPRSLPSTTPAREHQRSTRTLSARQSVPPRRTGRTALWASITVRWKSAAIPRAISSRIAARSECGQNEVSRRCGNRDRRLYHLKELNLDQNELALAPHDRSSREPFTSDAVSVCIKSVPVDSGTARRLIEVLSFGPGREIPTVAIGPQGVETQR